MQSPTGSRASAARSAWLAAAVFALGVLRYVPFIDDAWDNTLASTNGASYTARIVRSFQYAGFGALRGQPHLWVRPLDPPEGQTYVHHPPLWFWIEYAAIRALGWSEAAFRVLPVLCSALAAAALFLLVARYFGMAWGLGASALSLVLPMSLLYGWMPLYDPWIHLCLVWAFLLHDALRDGPIRRWWPALIPCFLGPQFDWQGAFIGPGLVIFELVQPRGTRRLGRVMLLVAPVAMLSVLVVVAINVYWAESFDGFRHLVGVANASAGLLDYSRSEWLRNQGRFLTEFFTWPVVVLGAAGLVLAAIVAPRQRFAGIVLGLFMAAVLNILLFRLHSLGHEFYWFIALPAAASAVVLLLTRFSRSHRSALVCGLVFAGVLIQATVTGFREYRKFATTSNRDIGRELDALAAPSDLILFPDEICNVSFYLRARTFRPVSDPAALAVIAGARGDPRLLADRLVFVTSSLFEADPVIQAELPRFAKVERFEGEAFRRRFPATSRLLPDLTVAWLGE